MAKTKAIPIQLTEEQGFLLAAWRKSCEKLVAAKQIVNNEQSLRKQVFEALFADAKEGTTLFDLGHGWFLKGTYSLDRKIDLSELDAIRDKLREEGIVIEDVVEWKPSLKTTPYKQLTDEQKLSFDSVLIIKKGSPILTLTEPENTDV